jgi:hypothetical protein
MAINAVMVGAHGAAAAATATTGGATTTTGSTFAAFVCYDATAGTITTAGDNKGNTYTAVGTPQTELTGALMQWYVCENGTGGAGHTFTFTTANDNYCSLFLVEITGATATPLDKNAQGSTTGLQPWATVSTGTLAQADELILSAVAVNNDGANPYVSNNGTILDQEPNITFYWTSAIAKHVVASTTSYAPSWNGRNGNGNVGMCLVTFKEGAGGGGSSIAAISNYYRMMRSAQ